MVCVNTHVEFFLTAAAATALRGRGWRPSLLHLHCQPWRGVQPEAGRSHEGGKPCSEPAQNGPGLGDGSPAMATPLPLAVTCRAAVDSVEQVL